MALHRHRLTALALTGVLALGMAGCSEDSPPKTTPSTSPATASSEPTGPAEPVLPDLASRKDAVGAKAFVKFYFAALTYAMKTGDTTLMDEYAAKDCEACAGISREVHAIYDSGGRLSGGGWRISQLAELQQQGDDGLHHLIVEVLQAPQRRLEADGNEMNRAGRKRFAFNVWVSRPDERWAVREIQKIHRASR